MLRAGQSARSGLLSRLVRLVVAVKQLKSAHTRSKSRMLVRDNNVIDVKM